MVDGELSAVDVEAEDIAAERSFDAFELKFDFLTRGENATCGIHYLVADGSGGTGDAAGSGGPGDSGGSDDALDTAAPDASHGASARDAADTSRYCRMASQKIVDDRWNQGVIRVRPDRRVDYWLNGYKILEYRRAADDASTGRVRLEHDGGDVAYRSIKIRELN